MTEDKYRSVVKGWTFPQEKILLTLPEDYPLNVPFYRLAIVPNRKDISSNTTIDYSMKMVPYRKENLEASAMKKNTFVKVDKSTGMLKLIKKPPSSSLRGRRRHRLFATILLTGFSKNNRMPRTFEILLEFSGSLENYCSPKSTICFPSESTSYSVPEDSITGVAVDYLMNPGLTEVCPNISLYYSLLPDQNLLMINSTTGALQLVSEADSESLPNYNFSIKCSAEKEDFFMSGIISFTDVNDNAPTTQFGNYSLRQIFYIKPGDKYFRFFVSSIDKDSSEVNNLVVRIENDTLNLFQVARIKQYERLPGKNPSFLGVDIESGDLLKHVFHEYNFSVVVEDKSLQQKDKKVVFEITIIRESVYHFEHQTFYERNISRKATQFARILQISSVPLQDIRFGLADGREKEDWLNVTDKSGIVYVRDPLLMTNASTEQRKIIWWRSNNTHEILGSSILKINIYEGPTGNCSIDLWCAAYFSQDTCINQCGKGSPTGRCSWRQEPLTATETSAYYSACSPDLTSCPNGYCDELEDMDPSICPFDCSYRSIGSRVPDEKRGIQTAKGVCKCLRVDMCSCFPPFAELRELSPSNASNRSAIEIKNMSIADAGKRFVYADETSTPIESYPIADFLTDGTCGLGCVVLASIAPCAVVLLIVTIIAVRRIKSNNMSHLKKSGSRISLSAVPSDYVQERPNSVQDSRTTSSDSSSIGKIVLDPKWEFPRNRLQFQTILGEGEFGKVIKAQALNIAGKKGLTTVAVKMLKENGGTEEMQDLISEFTLLKDISHPNVIKLLGASTEKGGPFYLIVEYAEMGSLRSYLRKRRKHNSCCKYNMTYGIPDVIQQTSREYYQFMCERSMAEPRHCYFHKEQLSYSWQIAKGMAYLADMKLVHRDLAARNVLLTKRKVVKISDFGLSRDIYKGEAYFKKTKGRVPVKWLAIESLEDQIYTSRSDVWSFGIVLWEIMTQGAMPYPGVTPQRLFNLLKAGYRMSKPDYCPDELYAIMRQCWKRVPNERPSFKELVHKLENLLQDSVEYMDFDSENTYSSRKRSIQALISFSDPSSSSTLQYTSVFHDNDEEFSDLDSPDNIGLVNLFNEIKN